MREIGERLDWVALSGFMYCKHCRWADGDCLQFNEDLPQPAAWSRRSASRGCSPQTGSRLCILLHLETEMKRDGGSVSTQKKVKSTHCPCEVHLIHSVCSHETVVEIPFHGIFFLLFSVRNLDEVLSVHPLLLLSFSWCGCKEVLWNHHWWLLRVKQLN